MSPDAGAATDERTSDQPLAHPDQDLLGVASHAAELARLVSSTPTPFTIGVYGEWGAGKTTFVRFVEHYLAAGTAPPAASTLFVHFEGWQHRTADELWRALMLEVARAVYVRKAGKEAVAPHAPAPENGHGSFRRLLGTYAVGGGTPEAKPQDEYWKFVERLDSTLYGGISKRSPEALRLDQEEAVLAAVRASVAALSAASPLVAGVRQLLGVDTKVDAGRLFQRERNEATRERIESKREFQEALRTLLNLLPPGERICVFLDDLDRCMPDVVLDLLEAIKIFLHVERMVFVVAADEELIGKGLRLRYRELLEGSGGEVEGEFLARKGQEYFEKIIQLRISLPECTPEHAHRFIAAQFPEWMPATDIILAAVGSNPRRLKQYCSWLTFRRMVDQAERKKKEREKEKDPERRRREKRTTSREVLLPPLTDEVRARRAALFDKLIALASRDAGCLAVLQSLAQEDDFAALMERMERHLAEAGAPAAAAAVDGTTQAPLANDAAHSAAADGASPDAADDTPAGRLARLCRRVAESPSLLRHFRAPPSLAAYANREVETFAAMADLRPHRDLMLTASDAPFMRILRHLAQPGTSAPDRIFQEDLVKLITIQTAYPQLFDALLSRADNGWAAGTRALEAALEAGDRAGLSEKWALWFEEIRQLDQAAAAGAGPTTLLMQSPRLSEILDEEVRALGARLPLPDPAALLSHAVYSDSSPASRDEKRRRLARWVLDTLPPGELADVLTRVELRQWAATHCMELRGFARLNGLERQWPELARMLRTDRATLQALEGEAMRPGSIAPEHREVWNRYKGDERLRRFLVLKPLVTDIAPAEVREYFSVSESIAPAADVGAPRPAETLAPAPVPRPRFDYVDVSITLEAAEPEPSPPAAEPQPASTVVEPPGDPRRPVRFRVRLEDPEASCSADAEVPWGQLYEAMAVLHQREFLGPESQAFASRERSQGQRASRAQTALRGLGALMWRWVFVGEVGARMRELHGRRAAIRLLLKFPSSVAQLPWETLYLEEERSFLGLTQRYSLVRYMSERPLGANTMSMAPLRILVMLANPADTAPLNLEGELAAIEEALRPAMEEGRVLLKVLEGEAANRSQLQQALRTFQPQIFHFTGHGVFRNNEGALVLHSPQGAVLTMGTDMANLLRDAHIPFVFLNSCDTGTAAENDAITGVAESLVKAGVPAVIATLREIMDDAGLLFTSELYRAFAEGYPLEAAMAEARKRLSVERHDWSAYALFSSARALDELMFPQGGLRST
jgi:hypothetical protein